MGISEENPGCSLSVSFFTKEDGPEHVDTGLDRAVDGDTDTEPRAVAA